MLSLNLVVRAVIPYQGKLLLTVLNDGKRAPFHQLLGGHLDLGESLTQCIVREVAEEVGLTVAPSRLLYVVENWFARGSQKLHEVGFYFICHPVLEGSDDLLASLSADAHEQISPVLLTPDELAACDFQPAGLRAILAADAAAGLRDAAKLIVLNDLPGDVEARPGVYAL